MSNKISRQKYNMAINQLNELLEVYATARQTPNNQDRSKSHLINKMLVVFSTSILEGVNLKPVRLKKKKIDELTKTEKYFLALHALRNSIIHNSGNLQFIDQDVLIKESYYEVCKEIPELRVELKEQVCIANKEVLKPLIIESMNYLKSKSTVDA